MTGNLATLVSVAAGAVDLRELRFRDWNGIYTRDQVVTVLAAALLSSTITRWANARPLSGYLRNPVAAGGMTAFLLMIVVSVSGYVHAKNANSGIGVGSFVGMAAVALLPRFGDVACAALLGAGYFLLLKSERELRVVATPRLHVDRSRRRRGYDADRSRRRRGYDADRSWRRRGSFAATPRVRRGCSQPIGSRSTSGRVAVERSFDRRRFYPFELHPPGGKQGSCAALGAGTWMLFRLVGRSAARRAALAFPARFADAKT